MKLLISLYLFILPQVFFAQKIENVRFTEKEKKVEILYDITGAAPEQRFDIKLFSSTNGGKSWTQLKTMSGDAGTGIKGGKNKKAVWDALKDVTEINGKIKFDVRAKISNSKSQSKNETGTLKDIRDKKIYKTVKIGTQWWMAENLNYKTDKGSWCYNNEQTNCDKYGRLYDWETAKTACPKGWHLPSKNEFDTLLTKTGGSGSMSYNQLIKNETSGFDALFGGWYTADSGNFFNIEASCYCWSSNKSFTDNNAWILYLFSNIKRADMGSFSKGNGFSVRCLRDK
ncbi:MAG: hypothetical protein HY958_04345 [Bacteroidia bacterium]|nr:hypothetical protein [Bacteroidia bacterium]